MPIMVIYRASAVERAAYAPYEAELQQTPVPAEALLHQVGFDGDEFVCVDVWSSRAPFEAWTRSYIKPMLVKHGLPYAEPEVFETMALATHDGIDAYKVLATARAPALA